MTLVDGANWSQGPSNPVGPISRSKVRKSPLDHLTGGRTTLFNYISTRNWLPYRNSDVVLNLARNHGPFLDRLNLMKKLPVHSGCVNALCWNKTGKYLLSGSDDRNLCITKPAYLFDTSKDYTVLHKIQTRHYGNIFCARFMPNSNDNLIVSCSSEGPVIVHDLNSLDPTDGLLSFGCHSSTIYEVVPLPEEEKVFLSCSEDKTVRLFDMRVHNSCARPGTCPHPALIRNSSAMTTLNLHPLNSNLLLVGRADGLGLVYDRRKLPDVTKFSRERAHMERLAGLDSSESFFKYMHPLDGVVSQFTVPNMDDKYRFTSLCFNSTGRQILASFSGDYVYLFDHDRSSNVELRSTLPKKPTAASSTSSSSTSPSSPSPSSLQGGDGEASGDGNKSDTSNRTGASASRSPAARPPSERASRGARISRIRLRGDWSDTGVDSRPRDRQDQTGSRHAIDFLQRMANYAFNLSIRRSTSDSSSGSQGEVINEPAEQPERIEEESDEENEDDEHFDENEDDEDTETNEESAFASYAAITSQNLLDEATTEHAAAAAGEHTGNNCDMAETNRGADDSRAPQRRDRQNDDDGSSSTRAGARSKVSSETKTKFRKTLDGLKNRFNQLPTYHPQLKYQGHRNSRTSIKEAIFWGDDYIMSGSDCGRIMVWEKESAKLVLAFPADEKVVNKLAPNPHHYCLASSGIDYDIKLWATQGLSPGPLKVSDEELARIIEINELMLEESAHTISVPPHLFFRVLASLASIDNNRN